MKRWTGVICALLLAASVASGGSTGSAKVIKVLPHFLDEKGRHALHPSLFDRDAYQLELRNAPEKRKALRFDVQWQASGYEEDLTLRLDVRSMHGRTPKNTTLQTPVKPRWRSRWTELRIAGDDYKTFGDLVAWKATILSGTNVVAEQKSFLW